MKNEGEIVESMYITVTKADVENGDISATLRELNRLKMDKASVQKYVAALRLKIEGYDDSPKELFEIRDVQKFMSKLDKEFPYWFYFLNRSGIGLTLRTLLLSIYPHYKESSSGKWKVQHEKFEQFMADHLHALEEMFDVAELDEEQRQMTRDEISTYFVNEFY
jgi:hypothetical protein